MNKIFNKKYKIFFLVLLASFLQISCNKNKATLRKNNAPTKFAIIGDYGADNENELAVSNLVKKWKPDFIITVGDNNYEKGEALTIDKNIGKYYHKYIGNYMGKYGNGSEENRFFPCLGNHDWYSDSANGYLNYFTLPGNERYYDFVKEPVHFFVLDSDEHEPDGITFDSKQAQWLKSALASSTSKFKIVYFHHPPYSSGEHGNEERLQWTFKEWGADIVICGHDHDYERLEADGFPYLVAGTGGRSLRPFKKIVPESKVRYSENYGAVLVKADESRLSFKSYSITNGSSLIDSFELLKN